MQQVCKESMDSVTCEQVYTIPVELNKFSRRRIYSKDNVQGSAGLR